MLHHANCASLSGISALSGKLRIRISCSPALEQIRYFLPCLCSSFRLSFRSLNKSWRTMELSCVSFLIPSNTELIISYSGDTDIFNLHTIMVDKIQMLTLYYAYRLTLVNLRFLLHWLLFSPNVTLIRTTEAEVINDYFMKKNRIQFLMRTICLVQLQLVQIHPVSNLSNLTSLCLIECSSWTGCWKVKFQLGYGSVMNFVTSLSLVILHWRNLWSSLANILDVPKKLHYMLFTNLIEL